MYHPDTDRRALPAQEFAVATGGRIPSILCGSLTSPSALDPSSANASAHRKQEEPALDNTSYVGPGRHFPGQADVNYTALNTLPN